MVGQIAIAPAFVASDWSVVGLPVTVALSAIALIGYLFGQRTRQKFMELDERRQRELDRAARIAWQLESIAEALRHDLIHHHTHVAAFKRRLRQARNGNQDLLWETLCNEAEAMLGPTMQLAHQLSHAYDQIRQQSDALETFTQGRTDPLTGVGNGRALDQQLQILLAGVARGTSDFAITIVSLKRALQSEEVSGMAALLPMLPKLASSIRSCMRAETDFVARYGDEEFVVVMPHASLTGASMFADRLRSHLAQATELTVCCGAAVAEQGDCPKSLLARADSALYSAKAAGANRVFLHTGSHIREHHAGTLLPHPGNEGEPASLETITNSVHLSTGGEIVEDSGSGQVLTAGIAAGNCR
jgi:diguanylate cyclase (GGDEF)-like protein